MLSDGNARAVFAWLAPAYWITGNYCPSTARFSNQMANTDVPTLIITSPILIICAHSNLTFLLVLKKIIYYLSISAPHTNNAQNSNHIIATSSVLNWYIAGNILLIYKK